MLYAAREVFKTQPNMSESEFLVINRDSLSAGKYTRWASRLSPDQLYALLWMIGEFGIRSSPDDSGITNGHEGRKEAARKAIVNFTYGRPIGFEEGRQIVLTSCEDPAIYND